MLIHTQYDDFSFGKLIYREETYFVTTMKVEINGLIANATFKIIMN